MKESLVTMKCNEQWFLIFIHFDRLGLKYGPNYSPFSIRFETVKWWEWQMHWKLFIHSLFMSTLIPDSHSHNVHGSWNNVNIHVFRKVIGVNGVFLVACGWWKSRWSIYAFGDGFRFRCPTSFVLFIAHSNSFTEFSRFNIPYKGVQISSVYIYTLCVQ